MGPILEIGQRQCKAGADPRGVDNFRGDRNRPSAEGFEDHKLGASVRGLSASLSPMVRPLLAACPQVAPITVAASLPGLAITVAASLPRHAITVAASLPGHAITVAASLPRHAITVAASLPGLAITVAASLPRHPAVPWAFTGAQGVKSLRHSRAARKRFTTERAQATERKLDCTYLYTPVQCTSEV